MGTSLTLLYVLTAVILVAIAGRSLLQILRTWRISRERRAGEDRRREDLQVPIERRRDHRRQ